MVREGSDTVKVLITEEQLEEVARAMWDENCDNDGTPTWDNLQAYDQAVKQEFRIMARAAIKKWFEITSPAPVPQKE